MAVFKRTLKIPTQNNKLGIAEKTRCRKMLADIYGLTDSFFKEIDNSIKKNCKERKRCQNLSVYVPGIQPGSDDGHRQSDAMEIPDAQRTEENAAQHDGKNHP